MTANNYVTLNRTEDKMPLVGFSTLKVRIDDAEETIYNAIKAGLRLIDCAADHGNEVQVGRGINKAIKEGIVTREEVFVVTKLWNTFHGKDKVRAAFDKQLKDLDLEYVDLYLIHWPIALKFIDFDECYPPGWYCNEKFDFEFEAAPMYQTWGELEKLVEAKLVRNIGISNFNVQAILDLLTYAKIRPAVLQVEVHPYLQQTRLVEWVQSRGIHVTTYCPFGPTTLEEMVMADDVTAPLLVEHDIINVIAKRSDKTPRQVLLSWSIRNNVAVIIPKSTDADHMKSSLDIFSWSLNQSDLREIDTLDRGLRLEDPYEKILRLPLFC